ncbi:MAG: NAD-reducing hydrogenase HoxS subunit alpha [Phycisphaerae bacterium]|nr:NAD-reducing hydrogenase HoxS subunit alpha [Phycisphaerae bacterium]
MTYLINGQIESICVEYQRDRHRLLDIIRSVQQKFGYISDEAIDEIARCCSIPRVEVDSTISFYGYLSKQPRGRITIRLCNDIIDRLQGMERVAAAFREVLGIDFGRTTADGNFSLEYAPCIGMCDQGPAALVNDVVVTKLTGDGAREMIRDLREHMDPHRLVRTLGDGNNAHELISAMVNNNIRQRGEVIFSEFHPGEALRKALSMSPVEVIKEIKTSRLRGRGGAGFPTGMKWEFTRGAAGPNKYVICNADEGEPGTFKDRVLLTECPEMVFEGMAIAGYAIGAEQGIVYLRGEYAYLNNYLEQVLQKLRKQGMLGARFCSTKHCFNFDIRIQMGAGAYICGEETALISSCEGLRGDPKNRPPFPAQKGYLENPTCVNNVETLCCVVRILEKGAAWFSQLGTTDSPGTKLLSISGDCRRPGVYELPFGVKLSEVLKLAGADNAAAVQVGGASGQMVGSADFHKPISYEGLATGGSIMVFGPHRNVLEIAHYFLEFFIDESCGYCTPCRVGNTLLLERLEQIIEGRGEPADLDYLQQLGQSIKALSRCGLGQTSPNPVLSTLKNFKPVYEQLVKVNPQGFRSSFDINRALEEASRITERRSVIYE